MEWVSEKKSTTNSITAFLDSIEQFEENNSAYSPERDCESSNEGTEVYENEPYEQYLKMKKSEDSDQIKSHNHPLYKRMNRRARNIKGITGMRPTDLEQFVHLLNQAEYLDNEDNNSHPTEVTNIYVVKRSNLPLAKPITQKNWHNSPKSSTYSQISTESTDIGDYESDVSQKRRLHKKSHSNPNIKASMNNDNSYSSSDLDKREISEGRAHTVDDDNTTSSSNRSRSPSHNTPYPKKPSDPPPLPPSNSNDHSVPSSQPNIKKNNLDASSSSHTEPSHSSSLPTLSQPMRATTKSIKKLKKKLIKTGSSSNMPKFKQPLRDTIDKDTSNQRDTIVGNKTNSTSTLSKGMRARPEKFMRRNTSQQQQLEEERILEMNALDVAIKGDWKTNIWEVSSPENLIVREDEENKYVVEAGTLNELIKHLTSFVDPIFLKTFLITYKSFTTPGILLKKLIQSYYPPRVIEIADPSMVKALQIRVVNIIIHWLELAPKDWDPKLVSKLDKLINDMKGKNSPLVSKMENKLIDMLEGIEKRIEARVLNNAPPIRIAKDLDGKVGVDVLFSVDPVEVARQITLIDWGIFSRFESVEFLNGAWNNKLYQHRAKNVLAMIHNFNKRSTWVAKNILLQTQFKKRIKTWKVLLDIATKLLEMNNFSSALAFYAAFENSSCHRLTHTRDALLNKKNNVTRYNALQYIADTNFNYKNYRDSLKRATPPCLPHLAVFLTDLTFIEEGCPDIINDKLINFKKRQLCYEVISRIRQYQLDPYNFTPWPFMQEFLSLDNMKELSDADLFSLSLHAEPRGWTPEKQT